MRRRTKFCRLPILNLQYLREVRLRTTQRTRTLANIAPSKASVHQTLLLSRLLLPSFHTPRASILIAVELQVPSLPLIAIRKVDGGAGGVLWRSSGSSQSKRGRIGSTSTKATPKIQPEQYFQWYRIVVPEWNVGCDERNTNREEKVQYDSVE